MAFSMRQRAIMFAAVFAGLSIPAVHAAGPASHAFDFITHNEVFIAAAPAQVWPHLRNVNAWKLGARATRFDGTADAVGERFKAAPENAPDNFYFLETVELVPDARWTVRLNAAGGDLMGYATWTLAAAEGGTRVRYDTFLLSRLPGDTAPGEVKGLAARTNQEASRRMDDEFSRLKKLAETAAPAR